MGPAAKPALPKTEKVYMKVPTLRESTFCWVSTSFKDQLKSHFLFVFTGIWRRRQWWDPWRDSTCRSHRLHQEQRAQKTRLKPAAAFPAQVEAQSRLGQIEAQSRHGEGVERLRKLGAFVTLTDASTKWAGNKWRHTNWSSSIYIDRVPYFYY